MSVSQFVDSGSVNPTIDLTVTSDSGKRVEKVSIVKSGDGFIAKRENDASLYSLSSGLDDALQKAAGEIKPAAPTLK